MPIAAVSDWAPAISATFAAVAATASWIAVRQTRRDFRLARQPEMEIQVIEGLDTGSVKIMIHNHGRSAARGVKFVVVEGDDATYGFLPPDATLAPGERRTLLTPMHPSPDSESVAVVICHDGDGYLHAWNAGGRHRRWKLTRPWNHRLSDERVTRHFYPGIDPFALNLVRHQVEP